MQINRVVIFVFNVLVLLAFLLRMAMTGPILYNRAWLFWCLFIIFGMIVFILSYLMLFHPTPLEVVSYHINLIMRHSPKYEDNNYDFKNKLYLSERFIKSAAYEFFYYGDCCAKIDQYSHMKIKLVVGQETFNRSSMIIKTMDDRYIKFNVIKKTKYPSFAFLYDWVIDQIEYSNQVEFLEMLESEQ